MSCLICGGTGKEKCFRCNGSGKIVKMIGAGVQWSNTISSTITCSNCNGSGMTICRTCHGLKGNNIVDDEDDYEEVETTCSSCYGSGKKRCSSYLCNGRGSYYGAAGLVICTMCGGSGKMTCDNCRGSGKMITKSKVNKKKQNKELSNKEKESEKIRESNKKFNLWIGKNFKLSGIWKDHGELGYAHYFRFTFDDEKKNIIMNIMNMKRILTAVL